MAATQGKLTFGDNITGALNGTKLTLEIDLSVPGVPSKSLKSSVVASTRGNQAVAPGVYLGLNVYRK